MPGNSSSGIPRVSSIPPSELLSPNPQPRPCPPSDTPFVKSAGLAMAPSWPLAATLPYSPLVTLPRSGRPV